LGYIFYFFWFSVRDPERPKVDARDQVFARSDRTPSGGGIIILHGVLIIVHVSNARNGFRIQITGIKLSARAAQMLFCDSIPCRGTISPYCCPRETGVSFIPSPVFFFSFFFPGRFKRARQVAFLILCKTQKHSKGFSRYIERWAAKQIKTSIIFFYLLQNASIYNFDIHIILKYTISHYVTHVFLPLKSKIVHQKWSLLVLQ